jgi:hypothetical protein
MGQFNIRLDDARTAALDALAAKHRLERPDFIRILIDEAVTADAQDRALFDRSRDFDPRLLGEIVQRVNQGMLEFDRKLGDIAKREADIAKVRRDDANRMSEARKDFVGTLPDRLKQAYAPFRADLAKLQTGLVEHPRLASIDERLERVEKLAGELRPNVYNQLNGVDLSWPKIAAVAVVSFLVSVVIFFALAAVFPQWIGVPTANRLLGGGDQAVCALVNYRMGTGNCRTTIDGSEMRVRVNADRAPDKTR